MKTIKRRPLPRRWEGLRHPVLWSARAAQQLTGSVPDHRRIARKLLSRLGDGHGAGLRYLPITGPVHAWVLHESTAKAIIVHDLDHKGPLRAEGGSVLFTTKVVNDLPRGEAPHIVAAAAWALTNNSGPFRFRITGGRIWAAQQRFAQTYWVVESISIC